MRRTYLALLHELLPEYEARLRITPGGGAGPANFATVDNNKEGLPSLGSYVPVEVFLGDYYDLSNGVWRISQ